MNLDHLKRPGDVIFLSPISTCASKLTKRLPSRRQLLLEIQYYLAKISALEAEGHHKSELTSLWMEIVTLKDQYRSGSGMTHYERIAEVSLQEKQSLINLFINLTGYSWSKNFGWIGQTSTSIVRPDIHEFVSPVSLFEGVDVKIIRDHEFDESRKHEPTIEGIVRGIDFSGFGCSGPMNDCLEDLPHVEYLIFNDSAISRNLPIHLTNMSHLKILSLIGNMLSGELNGVILSSLTSLEILNLSSNSLDGTIPDIFDSTIHLTELDLSGNQFNGILPTSIGCLHQLKVLNLFNNQLVGEIPTTFTQLIELQHVNLSKNKLSGGIGVFYHCHKLEVLNVRNNLMTDELLPDIQNWANIKTLYLADNQFHGSFHKEWCNLIELRHLNLNNNNLEGILPEEIGMMTSLVCLNLKENNLIGPLPLGLSRLTQLKEFKMITSFPSDMMYVPEAFSRHTFERVYMFGPSTGMNNVHWKPSDLHDDDQSISSSMGSLRLP